MGLALARKGCPEEAIVSLETTVQLSPSFTLATGFLAASYARAGEPERAQKLMDEVMAKSSEHYVSAACFGVYHAALRHADQMFEYLETALAERDPYLTRIDAEPCFEPFRTDPRYRLLLARMNLG
jgi:Tfp pilus assembly protein PilF